MKRSNIEIENRDADTDHIDKFSSRCISEDFSIIAIKCKNKITLMIRILKIVKVLRVCQ